MSTMTSAPPTYDLLLELVRDRVSVRKLKSDPVPDDYIQKILEVGRWAMSGANGQPWEFIVVKDPETKKKLFHTFRETQDFTNWMEQMRLPELRHPSHQMLEEGKFVNDRNKKGWSEAPFVIVLLGDGRRQWSTILGAHTYGLDQTHLSDGLANAAMLMHLAGASLGLGSQHVTIQIEQPLKNILGVPDLLRLVLMMPFGFPDVPPMAGSRRPLADMVHEEKYDMSKYMSNQDIIKYLYELRGKTIPIYRNSYTGDAAPAEPKT
jgi:5,6-dimethylbenzimidazole synthase